jgi:glutamate--cysteine ligase
MVPHLTTALTGPLLDLERRILDKDTAVERWLRTQWLEHTPPFYSSVDLRNAGFKLAPVDTNLFPGGFNNLNPAFLPLCVQAAMSAIEKICPEARNLLLVPENHTRNQFYLMNVARLAPSCTTRDSTCASAACCRRSPNRPRSTCPTARSWCWNP